MLLVCNRGAGSLTDFIPVPAEEAVVATVQSDESVVDRSYVKKKLEHGLTRIWQVSFWLL